MATRYEKQCNPLLCPHNKKGNKKICEFDCPRRKSIEMYSSMTPFDYHNTPRRFTECNQRYCIHNKGQPFHGIFCQFNCPRAKKIVKNGIAAHIPKHLILCNREKCIHTKEKQMVGFFCQYDCLRAQQEVIQQTYRAKNR